MKQQHNTFTLVKKTILPAVAGTTLMTLFSYWIAHIEKRNFSEAELLAKIEKRLVSADARKAALPAGWVTHYAIGILMIGFFNSLSKNIDGRHPVKRGVVWGSLGGLMAIPAWKLLFRLLPARSHTYYKKYYQQLFAAHIVFALAAAWMQRIINKHT